MAQVAGLAADVRRHYVEASIIIHLARDHEPSTLRDVGEWFYGGFPAEERCRCLGKVDIFYERVSNN